MSIVTKLGDRGKTRLYSGEEVSKGNRRLDTYGTLDELVSFIGLARAMCEDKEVSQYLQKYQELLFRLGTELATKNNSGVKLDPIKETDVQEIDDAIAAIETRIKLPRHFVLPGSNKASATIDVSRAVCRRLERTMVTLHESGEWKNPDALVFINRFSDLLFLLARKVGQK